MPTPPPSQPPQGRPNPGKAGLSRVQPPKGTRDLYPEDALKRRYIEQCWRDASIRCGFEEIHGPTFETTDLYAVKSGEGILGELFQAYSGKAPEEVEQVRDTGRAPYAMRPEFTPTLARMYAAKAGSLPKPCKWFTGGPYFRAERPQRGRLREFLQWNVDVIGLPGDLGSGLNAEDAEGNAEVAEAKAWMDAECAECCATLIDAVGFGNADMQLHVSHRELALTVLEYCGASQETTPHALSLLDRRQKISQDVAIAQARNLGIRLDQLDKTFLYLTSQFHRDLGDLRLSRSVVTMPMVELFRYMDEIGKPEGEFDFFDTMEKAAVRANEKKEVRNVRTFSFHDVQTVMDYLDDLVGSARYRFDASIVRGLAYYTGTVFEVLADGERAVAGGGRYDKLIELMGGPPTPAVGFAMGDVVLSLLLEDKGLMPKGAELMEAVSRRPASVRPEVFVVGADDDNSDACVRRLAADLRRGVEAEAYQQSGERKPWSAARYDAGSGGVRPLHARVSYKSTRNLKKLLADGEKQFARLAAIVHGPDRVQLKDFDTRRDLTPKDVGLSDTHAEFSTDPASVVYVGRAAARVVDAI